MDSNSGGLKGIFKHSLVYGIGAFLKKALGFVLIPLYTSQFEHFQYGKLAMLYLYSGAIMLLFLLGLNDAFFKQFSQKDINESEVFSRFFLFRLAYSFIFLIILTFLSEEIYTILIGGNDIYLIKLATLTIWIEALAFPSLLVLRIKNKSKKYVIINTLRFGLNCGLNVLFVLHYNMGVGGVMLGNLLSGLVLFFLLYPEFHSHFTTRIDWAPLKKLLLFGLPLLPLSYLLLGLELADRWIIKYIKNLGEAGIYTLGYQFGAAMGILVYGFKISWVSFFYNNPEKKDTFARSSVLFTRISLILWAFISLFTLEIFNIMVAENFHSAMVVVPLIALSYIFYGLEEIFAAGFYIKSRTYLLFPIALLALITNVLLNFFLIPELGITGAAIATLVTFVLFSAVTILVAQRFFFVNYKFNSIITDIAVSSLIFYISKVLLGNLLFRIIGFITILAFIGFEERRRIKNLLSTR